MNIFWMTRVRFGVENFMVDLIGEATNETQNAVESVIILTKIAKTNKTRQELTKVTKNAQKSFKLTEK